MTFVTPEQLNATRRCVCSGDWRQGLRIATGPLRVSLRRYLSRTLRRPACESASCFASPSFPDVAADAYPLYVDGITDFECVDEPKELFRDVDRQLAGEFRLAGGRYVCVQLDGADQFDEVEDRHALSRLYWAARYAKAAAFGHPDATLGLRSHLTKWFRIQQDSIALAPYTVAERIASLSECLVWAGHFPEGSNGDDIISIKRQIWNDAHRLSATIEYGLGVHNHLLNDARGLFRASRVLRDVPEATGWREQAVALWDEYFPKLVLEDGSCIEQSSHYQLLMCRTGLEYFLAARLSQRPLPKGFAPKLARLFQLADDLLRPDGSLPRFGDNSPDHVVEDLHGLGAAACHYGLLKNRPRHASITPLTLFYCGQAPRLPVAAPPSVHISYPAGGFMFLRSTDGSLDLAVHADPRSEIGAHGNPARGTFELGVRGRVVVREPGSVLSGSHPRSDWSRSGLGQNVTSLNGLPSAVSAKDRRFMPPTYANRGGAWLDCDSTVLQFRWNGFERIRDGITVVRTWHLDGSGDVSLEERIDGSGDADFESRLCLGDDLWTWSRSTAPNECALHREYSDESAINLVLTLPLAVKGRLEEGSYFPEFGVERKTAVLVLSGTVALPIHWTASWRFCAAPQEKFARANRSCAE